MSAYSTGTRRYAPGTRENTGVPTVTGKLATTDYIYVHDMFDINRQSDRLVCTLSYIMPLFLLQALFPAIQQEDAHQVDAST